MRDFHLTPPPARVITPPTVAELLEFEREHAGHPKKATIIRQRWDWRDTRYEQELRRALGTTEALHHDAELTHRLIRIRDNRTRARASRDIRTNRKANP